MRGDARKRYEARLAAEVAKRYAPCGVSRERNGWSAACVGGCNWPLDHETTTWEDAFDSASIHAYLFHGATS